MSIQLQPPVPLVTLVNAESPTVIKNEPPEEALEEETSTNIKDDIDIVYQPLCADLIKSETVLENEHLESSVQTQVLVKAENSPFIKTENITQRNKSEDTSDGTVSRVTGQGVVEVQGLNEHFNTLDNLETDEQLVLTFPSDLNRIRKEEHSKKTNVAECYNTLKTISWKKDKEKIKIIKAPLIPVEPHEYTYLGKDKHLCNHCQCECTKLFNLKRHINLMHREVTTRYQCPYCPYYYKSKWKIQEHIISKHKDAKDIQWFQCHFCEKKYKLKYNLTQHLKVHLTHERTQDDKKFELCPVCGKGFTQTSSVKRHMRFIHNKEKRNKEKRKCRECEYTTTKKQLLELHIKNTHANYEKRYHCNKCNYKTYKYEKLNTHKLNHLKPEDMQYFYCYHCSFKSKQKINLQTHIFRHFKREEIKFHCYICDFMTPKRDMIIKHLKKHFKHRTNSDEVKCKYQLENHTEIRYHYCNKCDYKTDRSTSLKKHNITHLKPEEIQYFYCYHCSFKFKYKNNLKTHIFRHFKREEIKFYCYICDFMTLKRDMIIKHLKKHFKHGTKSDEVRCTRTTLKLTSSTILKMGMSQSIATFAIL